MAGGLTVFDEGLKVLYQRPAPKGIDKLDKAELKALIAGGETATLEMKINPPWQAELSQRLCGFANSPLGGMLVFGVEDRSWAIRGVKDPAATVDEVLNAAGAANPSIPLVPPGPQIIELEGVKLVVVQVPPNDGILYQAGGAYWLRRGTITRTMTTEQVSEYMHRQGLLAWETQPNLKASLDDLDWRKIERYLQHLSEVAGRPSRVSDPLQLLQLLECAVAVADGAAGDQNEKVVRPTNAGLLLFGEAPRYFYPQAEVICTYYKDDTGVRRYEDRRIITGSISEQIEQAYAFLKLYTPVAARVEGLNRIDEPALPLEALREAVVNALVHRDYSLRGEAVRIFYYSNRVEIHNPGLLVPGLSLEELKQGRSRSKPRNPVIASILRDMPGNYMERVGTGIPFILNQMRTLNLPDPEFNELGEFVVTFWLGKPSTTRPTASGLPTQSEQPPPRLPAPGPEPLILSEREARQRKALDYVRQHGYITNSLYQKLGGVSESTATRDLEGLVELGSLKRTGRGPSRRYLL